MQHRKKRISLRAEQREKRPAAFSPAARSGSAQHATKELRIRMEDAERASERNAQLASTLRQENNFLLSKLERVMLENAMLRRRLTKLLEDQ